MFADYRDNSLFILKNMKCLIHLPAILSVAMTVEYGVFFIHIHIRVKAIRASGKTRYEELSGQLSGILYKIGKLTSIMKRKPQH
jgi:hypothetical protein